MTLSGVPRQVSRFAVGAHGGPIGLVVVHPPAGEGRHPGGVAAAPVLLRVEPLVEEVEEVDESAVGIEIQEPPLVAEPASPDGAAVDDQRMAVVPYRPTQADLIDLRHEGNAVVAQTRALADSVPEPQRPLAEGIFQVVQANVRAGLRLLTASDKLSTLHRPAVHSVLAPDDVEVINSVGNDVKGAFHLLVDGTANVYHALREHVTPSTSNEEKKEEDLTDGERAPLLQSTVSDADIAPSSGGSGGGTGGGPPTRSDDGQSTPTLGSNGGGSAGASEARQADPSVDPPREPTSLLGLLSRLLRWLWKCIKAIGRKVVDSLSRAAPVPVAA